MAFAAANTDSVGARHAGAADMISRTFLGPDLNGNPRMGKK
jgi:hypothetical protein